MLCQLLDTGIPESFKAPPPQSVVSSERNLGPLLSMQIAREQARQKAIEMGIHDIDRARPIADPQVCCLRVQ